MYSKKLDIYKACAEVSKKFVKRIINYYNPLYLDIK